MFTVPERDAALPRAVDQLSQDERVEAIVLTGSLGRGGGDRWSDIDLDVVVSEGTDAGQVATEWEARTYREWPVAHHYATEFGATQVRGFLLRNGLLLDLAFTPVTEFTAWAPVRVMFDRTGRVTEVAANPTPWAPTADPSGDAGFAAHDVLHACVAANRGRAWQSVYFLQRIRNRTLALGSERHGYDAEDFAHVDDLPPDEIGDLAASLVSSLERAALLEAVDRAARAYLSELRRHDETLAARLTQPFDAIIKASMNEPNKSDSKERHD